MTNFTMPVMSRACGNTYADSAKRGSTMKILSRIIPSMPHESGVMHYIKLVGKHGIVRHLGQPGQPYLRARNDARAIYFNTYCNK